MNNNLRKLINKIIGIVNCRNIVTKLRCNNDYQVVLIRLISNGKFKESGVFTMG